MDGVAEETALGDIEKELSQLRAEFAEGEKKIKAAKARANAEAAEPEAQDKDALLK